MKKTASESGSPVKKVDSETGDIIASPPQSPDRKTGQKVFQSPGLEEVPESVSTLLQKKATQEATEH